MHRAITAVLLGMIFCFSSCGPNRDKKIAEIKDLEAKVLKDSAGTVSGEYAYNLQMLYGDFAEKFPQDPESPEYMFKSANLSIRLGWGKSAIELLDLFLAKYPNDKHAPEAMFFKAYVYDNQVNDDAKAGEAYSAYISKYPTHAYAADAQASIKNLGKTDEELIKEFEKMNMDSTSKDTSIQKVG